MLQLPCILFLQEQLSALRLQKLLAAAESSNSLNHLLQFLMQAMVLFRHLLKVRKQTDRHFLSKRDSKRRRDTVRERKRYEFK